MGTGYERETVTNSSSISDFYLLNFNLQSMRNKHLLLDSTINSMSNLKVLCFTEHWLRAGEIVTFGITNFKLLSSFCRSTHIHGGVSVYIHHSLKGIELNTIKELSREIHCEIIGIHIKTLNLVVVTVYRSPCRDSNFDIFFNVINRVLRNIDDTFPRARLVFCGDFNLNFRCPDNRTKQVVDLFLQFDLRMTVNGFTRHSGSSRSCPDNIFCNFACNESEIIHLGASDHDAQVLGCSMGDADAHSDAAEVTFRRFSDANLVALNHSLGDESWTDVFSANTTTKKVEIFHEIFMYHFNNSVPKIKKKKKTQGKDKIWITPELHRQKQILLLLHSNLKNNPTDCNRQIYNSQKRQV